MTYRLTASHPNKPTESSVYFTRHAAEIAQRVYEADGYTVTIEEVKS